MRNAFLLFAAFAFVAVAITLGYAHAASESPSIKSISSPLFYKSFGPHSLNVSNATVPEIRRSWNFNTASLRGSYEFNGVLTFEDERASTLEVLLAVDRAVNAVTRSSHIEGVNPNMKLSERLPVPDEFRNKGDKPTWSMWMYNWEDRHGELHVWLFPYPNGDIGFAVHHLEEPLK